MVLRRQQLRPSDRELDLGTLYYFIGRDFNCSFLLKLL